jgi:SAM-dependent methyltransferase
MDTGYATAYIGLYQNHWWWRAREAILLRRLADVIDHARPARILDVGCGAGLFFDALERFGHVEGIESDAALVEQSGPWRDRIVVGELDDSFRPEGSFDAILMLDVLEHVSNPERMLSSARRILAPGGRIVITVPAFECLWTSHDDLNHHLRRYTPRRLCDTVREAGLATESVGYLFQSLVIPKLFVRAAEAMKGGPPRVPRVPSPAINTVLRKWFQTELLVSKWLPFGTSLIAIVRSDTQWNT